MVVENADETSHTRLLVLLQRREVLVNEKGLIAILLKDAGPIHPLSEA